MSYRIPTIFEACTLSPDLESFNRTEQVEHLAKMIDVSLEDAKAFFQRNHVTKGMAEFVRLALRRLSGQPSEAVYELKQAMGGGKTHNMLVLGMIAKYPELLSYLPADVGSGLDIGSVQVAAINGRSVDQTRYLWGDIATQLGKEEEFRRFWINGAQAPTEQDWKQILGNKPTLIFLDELPPYFDYATTIKLGHGTLANQLKYALANLFSAAMNLPNCVIVMASLSGSYQAANREIEGAIRDVAGEARRGSKQITPVDLSTGEIYDILKKRLFTSLPDAEVIDQVAAAYAGVLSEAVRGKFLPKSAEAIADEIADSYPFHPGFKDILALFKENERFRQTRGLIEFSANLMRGLWAKNAKTPQEVYLAGVQHFDFGDQASRDQVRSIVSALDAALARDIYEDNQSAHAQVIDEDADNEAASQTANLIFISSLSDSLDGVKGLSAESLLEYLVAPGQSPAAFSTAFEELRKVCWYLHTRDGDRFYFSDQANLLKNIEDRATRAPEDKAREMVKRKLEQFFRASSRHAYQQVIALPELSEVRLSASQRLCIIYDPDAKEPPEKLVKFMESQTLKNALMVVCGDGTPFTVLLEKAKRIWAIERIRHETGNDPRQAVELNQEESKANLDFLSSLVSLLTRVWYPSVDRATGNFTWRSTRLQLKVENNEIMGEAGVEAALSDTGVSKLKSIDPMDFTPLIARVEHTLFGTQRRILWNDLIERAASRPEFYWLPPKGLEEIRQAAVRDGRWSFGDDNMVDRDPPKPRATVRIDVKATAEDDGFTTLKLEAINAGDAAEIWMSRSADVFESGEILASDIVKTKEVELWFAARDPEVVEYDREDEKPEIKAWRGRLYPKISTQLIGDTRRVTLTVMPDAELRWNTTGINPRDGQLYDGPIELPATERVTLYVHAEKTGVTAQLQQTFDAIRRQVIEDNEDEDDVVGEELLSFPARTSVRKIFTSRPAVMRLVDGLCNEPGVRVSDLNLRFGEGEQLVRLKTTSDNHLEGDAVKNLIAALELAFPDAADQVSLDVGRMTFETRDAFEAICEKARIDIGADEMWSGI